MTTKTLITQEKTSHSLEGVFGIEPNTTTLEHTEIIPTEIIQSEEYDDKDLEIEQQIQGVIDCAMANYEHMSRIMENCEQKYASRSAEVANQSLSTALAAIKEKLGQKSSKDKNAIDKEKGGTTNNNLFIDRNDLLKMLNSKD